MAATRSLVCYCQHSVGVGHLVRSLALVSELKHWYRVTLICGGQFPSGFEVPKGIHFVQLPALRLNAQEQLEAVNSEKPLHQVMTERKKKVLEVYKDVQPDILMTDYFPFGKKEFVGELLPLLKRAKTATKPVLVVCSLRDILEPKSTAKTRALDLGVPLSNSYYDALLIHSDPEVIRLQDSYAHFKSLQVAQQYTGFITNAVSQHAKLSKTSSRVVLSIGGGKVGASLVHRVVALFKERSSLQHLVLEVVSGPNFPDEEYSLLKEEAKGAKNIVLTRQVSDLTSKWNEAAFSISMGGYNTTMELLAHGIPALIIPYHNEKNSEQLIRATRLHELGMLRMLNLETSNQEALAAAIESMAHFNPSTKRPNLNGVVRSVELLEDLYWEKSFHFKEPKPLQQ